MFDQVLCDRQLKETGDKNTWRPFVRRENILKVHNRMKEASIRRDLVYNVRNANDISTFSVAYGRREP